MEDYDDCCGFAGKFAFTNPKLSKEISKIKIKKALSVNPDIILTTCPACILGLKQGLFYNGKIFNAPKILSITDFLKLGKITNPQM